MVTIVVLLVVIGTVSNSLAASKPSSAFKIGAASRMILYIIVIIVCLVLLYTPSRNIAKGYTQAIGALFNAMVSNKRAKEDIKNLVARKNALLKKNVNLIQSPIEREGVKRSLSELDAAYFLGRTSVARNQIHSIEQNTNEILDINEKIEKKVNEVVSFTKEEENYLLFTIEFDTELEQGVDKLKAFFKEYPVLNLEEMSDKLKHVSEEERKSLQRIYDKNKTILAKLEQFKKMIEEEKTDLELQKTMTDVILKAENKLKLREQLQPDPSNPNKRTLQRQIEEITIKTQRNAKPSETTVLDLFRTTESEKAELVESLKEVEQLPLAKERVVLLIRQANPSYALRVPIPIPEEGKVGYHPISNIYGLIIFLNPRAMPVQSFDMLMEKGKDSHSSISRFIANLEGGENLARIIDRSVNKKGINGMNQLKTVLLDYFKISRDTYGPKK